MNRQVDDVVLSAVSEALDTTPSSLCLTSSFIGNGGDSLASIRLQSLLAEHGIQVSVSSVFTAKTILELVRRTIRDGCCSTTKQLRRGSVSEPASTSRHAKRRISICAIQDHDGVGIKRRCEKKPSEDMVSPRYPMTEMQLSMVRSSQENPARNWIIYIERHAPENLSVLKSAWQHALGSEEIFNMRFEVDASGGYMIPDKTPFIWEEIFVNDEAEYEREASRTSTPSSTNLVSSSFKAVTLKNDRGNKSTVIWRIHHSMIDGVSFARVRSKVQDILAGKDVSPSLPFSTFSVQLQSLQTKQQQSARQYWEIQKKNHPSPASKLLFPVSSSNTTGNDNPQGRITITPNTKGLSLYAKDIGVTLASLYHAAWGLVLSRFTDSDCICFGAVLSGATLPIKGADSVIGPTINTLPLHLSIDTSKGLGEYAREVFTSLLELTAYQFSTPADGFARDFLSAVNVHLEAPKFTGGPYDPLDHPCVQVLSDFPLQVDVGRCGRITISYDSGLFLRENIIRLGDALSSVLGTMARDFCTENNPTPPLSAVLDNMLDSQQLLDLTRLGNWKGPQTRECSAQDTLVSLFSKVARDFPSEVAVEHGSDVMTYGELDTKSSAVARYLTSVMRINPGDVICVHADGGGNWIVAIYGILKAGAVYCPLDPSWPETVRSNNYAVSGAVMWVTGDGASADACKPSPCRKSISVQEILSSPSSVVHDKGEFDCSSWPEVKPESAAYICFTSGSSGTPKGVLCRHAGLVAFQKDRTVRLKSEPGRRWKIAQFMSPGFDGSIHEIFSALSYGSTLVLRDNSDPFGHLKRCNAAILTPTVAAALDPADFPALEAVYLVGEAVPQAVCDNWASSSTRDGTKKAIYNMYGPTEATCGATIKKLECGERVTLGVPNASTRVYILDTKQRLVPRGMVGEIYLAGVQVAVGYLGQEAKTSSRFFGDAVCTDFEGERMYKTGDMGYWDENGELVCLGRRDRQIKLRGFRIDLDDLEVQIMRAAAGIGVSGLAVVTTKTADGSSLNGIAAVVKPATVDLDELAVKVKEHIPSYARPSQTVAVDEFPVSVSAKLDYKAIEAMVSTQRLGGNTHEEMDGAAQAVADAVRDVLGLPAHVKVDMGSSFTELGGNSILALTLANRLSQRFKERVPVSIVLLSASVRELAASLRDLLARSTKDDGDANRFPTSRVSIGDNRVSPIETEWWNKYMSAPGNPSTSSFNVTYACRLPVSLERARLVSSWNTVIERHPILRSRYVWSRSQGRLIRRYAKRGQPSVSYVENIDMEREINTPFNLAEDEDLLRVFISNTEMLVVISHIISDLSTLTQLLREVSDAYKGKELPPVSRTYSQTTTWSTPASPCSLAFWDMYLENKTSLAKSSCKIARRRKTWAGTSHLAEIPDPVHQSMIRFASLNKVTMHQLALAATAMVLHTIQNGHPSEGLDITLGAPYLNRSSEQHKVIGLFLEPLPIRIQYPPPPPPSRLNDVVDAYPALTTAAGSFIKTVQKSSTTALSHAIPWDQLLSRFSSSSRSEKRTGVIDNPIFDVMVTFHEKEYHPESMFTLCSGGERVKFIPTWAEGAKFPLMTEFSQSSCEEAGGEVLKLGVRLEYSTELLSPGDAQVIEKLLVVALEGLTANIEFESLVAGLREAYGSLRSQYRDVEH